MSGTLTGTGVLALALSPWVSGVLRPASELAQGGLSVVTRPGLEGGRRAGAETFLSAP